MSEAARTFTCFGGACTVVVEGTGPAGTPEEAVRAARDFLLEWHETFSRFKPASELARLNRDPRERVPVSPPMAGFAQAAVDVASVTGGLVDATLLEEIEDAGYRADHLRAEVALFLALMRAPARQPGAPHPVARWREIEVDVPGSAVIRPPGVKLDGGGIVKGLAADAVGEMLGGHNGFVVDCEGDMRVGGTGGVGRVLSVTSPFDGEVLDELAVSEGALATSDISKRSWYGPGMRPAHHLLDPATGEPAYTGVVKVTARAPTALEGEALAKAAVLTGPDGAPGWLPHGGLIVLDDGSHTVIPPP
jgi:FAD:protein FMN transferase